VTQSTVNYSLTQRISTALTRPQRAPPMAATRIRSRVTSKSAIQEWVASLGNGLNYNVEYSYVKSLPLRRLQAECVRCQVSRQLGRGLRC